jgi:serine/threonine protein kinase
MEQHEIRTIDDQEIVCDRYDSKNFIARGGYAEVYKGMLDGGCAVAIKYYKPLRSLSCLSEDGGSDGNANGDSEQLFCLEADILHALSSPCIVQLKGVQRNVVGTVNTIVMELALCTLNDVVHGEFDAVSISTPSVLSVLHDAATAIEYTHENGISHNDIKIDNFLLFPDGKLKLTDYGLSSHVVASSPRNKGSPTRTTHKALKSPTKPGGEHNWDNDLSIGSLPKVMRKGNTVYQAPELFVPPASYSPTCDVYALGVLVNEVLTGCRPYCGLTGAMLPVQICAGSRPTPMYGDGDADPSELDKRLRHLIRTCWEGSSTERPTAASVCKTLGRLLDSAGGERRDEYVARYESARSTTQVR